ncbi:MAG: IS66 family insertion sequence element accessory protein TnpB [Pseudoalteromonas sp.]|uniref:IS66 family insertion sequence element accessory protein TnpB n=1 Tax=Pseudoalteromonas TaxID=53246 RepID=UPI003F966E7C
MKMFVDPPEVYLCAEYVDFRKSINGLVALVETELELPMLSGALFVFCNKKRDKLKQWLEKHQLNLVGNSKLIMYINDGRLSIDNNRAKRAIKPFVIGSKNRLFSQTATGAHASAILYSIIETAKTNGLVPYDYITACLNELCQPAPNIDILLPWYFKA